MERIVEGMLCLQTNLSGYMEKWEVAYIGP